MEYLEQHFKDIDLHFKALEAKSGSTFPQVQFAAEIDPEPLPHEAEAEGRSNKLKRLKKVVKAKKAAQAQSETESFELCKALGRNGIKRSNASSNANTLLKMKDLTTCDAREQVAVFEPDEGSYSISCCAKDSLHCSGCMKLNGDSCDLCSGGFSDSSGTCEACLDLPGWETIDGVNCYNLTVASCDDVKVRGQGVRGFLCWSILYLRDSERWTSNISPAQSTSPVFTRWRSLVILYLFLFPNAELRVPVYQWGSGGWAVFADGGFCDRLRSSAFAAVRLIALIP